MDQQQTPSGQPIIDITSEPSHNRFDSGSFPVSLDGALRRRRKVFFSLLLVLSAAGAIWLWTQPRVYEATASILLTRVGAAARPVAESEIASEIELVWNQISTLGRRAAGVSGTVAESPQSADARLREMRSRIDVRQTGKSQILSVSYTDSNPRLASDRANQLAGLYLEQRNRLLARPVHLIAVEAEAAVLAAQADAAVRDLAEFDAKSKGASLADSFRIKSERLSAMEDRLFELKASSRGQEEVVRVLRRVPGPEALRGEAQLAGMRAKLQETEKEFARLERVDTLAGTLAAKRAELERKAELARTRAEFMQGKLHENHIAGMNLQARLVSLAELRLVRALELSWWQIALLALGILAIAWIGAWAVDFIDRPVYAEDDFARMTGAPPVHAGND